MNLNTRAHATLGLLVGLAACSEPMTPRPEFVAANAKQASAVLTNETFDGTINFSNPCPPFEPIAGTTRTHLLTTATTTPSGNTSISSSTTTNVDGVGVVTGLRYNGKESSSTSALFTSGAATVIDDEITIRMVSQGKAQNFLLVIKYHITYSANGIPTAEHQVVSSECK